MEEAIKTILNQGLLGAMLIVSGLFNAFQYRENKEVNNRRLDDMKQSRDAIVEPLRKLQETSDALVNKYNTQNEILVKALAKQ